VTDIYRVVDDTSVTFVAESEKAIQRMHEVYGASIKHFLVTERAAIIEFEKWAIREKFGLKI
jgi:hypothetical protein